MFDALPKWGSFICLLSKLDLFRATTENGFVAYCASSIAFAHFVRDAIWQYHNICRLKRLSMSCRQRTVSDHYADYVEQCRTALFKKACELDLEGIVAKDGRAPYDPQAKYVV